MKITKEQIEALDPCSDGYEWYLKNGTDDLLETLLKVNCANPPWARWLFTRLMSVKQRRMIAVFSAQQVLHIFEKKYPQDMRPRKAIEAAIAVIESDTKENRAAADAAAADANAAAYVAAADAAAADAAAAAYAAAYAAYAAAYSAYAAAYAAYVDAADAAARKEMQERIIKQAVLILDGSSIN